MREWWAKIRALSSREKLAKELNEETGAHLQMEIEARVQQGLSAQEALDAARREFGNRTLVEEAAQEAWVFRLLDTAGQDLRVALRSLRKNPAFSAVAVATLALGIGANTAVFSLVNQLLLHPPGIAEPDRIVAIQTRYAKQNVEFVGGSAAVLPDLQNSRDLFQYAAIRDNRGRDVNYTGGETPRTLSVSAVSAGWFDVYGAKPYAGRVFSADEDQPNANRVAVLSYGAWRDLFGGDRGVIGRSIQLNQIPHQVIGVMPPDFGLAETADLWLPAALQAREYASSNRFNEAVTLVARMRPGVSFEQANAWLAVLTSRVRDSSDQGTFAQNVGWSISAVPYLDFSAGENKEALLLLLGAVGFVLLIACSNIAGLMVARTSARTREVAVRTALGASRSRLFGQIASESVLLALAGGAAGFGLAIGAVRLLLLLAPEQAAMRLSVSLDIYVLLFCAGVSIGSGLLFAVAPSWQMVHQDAQAGLRAKGRGATDGRQRLRSVLVVAETALAVLLLVGAGLLLRSFVRLQNVNPGFDSRGVMTAMVILPFDQYGGPRGQSTFYRAVLDNLRAQPRIIAGLGEAIPLRGGNSAGSFVIEGRATDPNAPPAHGDRRFISPGYLEALSIPLRRGRYFTDDDRITSERVAIIDERLAEKYWPGEDPINQRIRIGQNSYMIVGIAGHVMHRSLATDSDPGVHYLPIFQASSAVASIVVKTNGDPASAVGMIQNAVRSANPNQAITTMRSMEDYIARSLATRRFGMRLIGFFAATALFLAALGLYGVISYSVTQRTREIGIRMALGAGRDSVTRMVVGQGFRLTGVGVAIGAAGSLLTVRLFQSQLFGVTPFDPVTIAGMAVLMLAVGLLAGYLPSRRAARVDPALTLRDE